MRTRVDGNPPPEPDLAPYAGFSRAASIKSWMRAFDHGQFIVRRATGERGARACRPVLHGKNAKKIYSYQEFRQIRPLIRAAPWFCPLFLEKFSNLLGDLPVAISKMLQQSHTFFEIIDTYDNPGKIWGVYSPCLYINGLLGIKDEEFNAWCLYYLLYVQSIVRDLPGGGPGDGFSDLNGDVQHRVRDCMREKVRLGGVCVDS